MFSTYSQDIVILHSQEIRYLNITLTLIILKYLYTYFYNYLHDLNLTLEIKSLVFHITILLKPIKHLISQLIALYKIQRFKKKIFFLDKYNFHRYKYISNRGL